MNNSGHQWEDPTESTFADVLNGFTLSSGRGRRGEPEARRRDREQAAEITQPADPVPQAEAETDESAAIVRAYAWTGGRTRSEVPLQIETLVCTSELGMAGGDPVQAEYRAIAQLCRQTRSVAEVAALLVIPLGVAKVLVGDMAGLGLVQVHATGSGDADAPPNMGLMERILSGLRKL
ncbi:hypothetical protein GCM10010174_39240 [Kutzneria viridogrisea]|uniref:DUF742 domain-containing protein n=2 Tax=Kutzneria TaxID=43356 RepID=W5WEH1_9PSEU|nr:DUF742 domain-containing protein [Kutzneria albida]AHH96574.1 hypothetical protein KALB_3207 [Kutzneria albida DSM 43870]MBA8928206.1 hypothetical protein [Kutzneria viridogrisea]